MKQQRLLWIAVILLFLMNAGTLFFLFSGKDKGSPGPGGNRAFDERVISVLQLNETQQQQFNDMKRQHHQKMMQLDEAMKEPFEKYFSLLKQATPDTMLKDSLERVITGIYLQKVQSTYDHFNELKNSCTPEQQKQFATLIPGLMQVISPRPPKELPHGGPPPPGRP